MQIFRETGSMPGFKVVELDTILPEIIKVGEHRAEEDCRWRTEALKHWLVFYVVEGTSRLGIEGGTEVIVKPGSVGCFPPKISYSVQHGPEPKHHVLWVSCELDAVEKRHPEWNLAQTLNGVHFAHDLTELEQCFLQVIREAATPSTHQACGLQLALDTLVLEVVRGINGPSKTLSLVSVHPAITKALAILETRFRKNWSLNEIAGEVGLSRSRLAQLFNLEAGCSIRKFQMKVRVRHAESLLNHSDLTIGDIASECGFATIQHFSRVFKEMNGQAPIAFRQR
jgi:AraC-like DNA-binding protein